MTNPNYIIGADMTFLCDTTRIWYTEAKHAMPLIKKVIFNPPATVVIWQDGKKTVVKAHNEEFDPEKGLAMCIAERYFGNYSRFKKTIEENLEDDNA